MVLLLKILVLPGPVYYKFRLVVLIRDKGDGHDSVILHAGLCRCQLTTLSNAQSFPASCRIGGYVQDGVCKIPVLGYRCPLV